MTKVCTQSTCRRTHDTRFKKCPVCRERARESINKRKAAAALKKCEEGKRICTGCSREQDEDQFVTVVNRREKPTVHCKRCRDSIKRTQANPNAIIGQCRQIFIDWKKEHVCLDCGLDDHRLIEADHKYPKDSDHPDAKLHSCSDAFYWACHGGPEALKKELNTKCEPRCRFCHRLKSMRDRKPQTQKSILQKRAIIDAEKLKRGHCVHCQRKVTEDNLCGFDYDHLNPNEKRINVSNMVYKSWPFFNQYIYTEMSVCALSCANCHHLSTFYK